MAYMVKSILAASLVLVAGPNINSPVGIFTGILWNMGLTGWRYEWRP